MRARTDTTRGGAETLEAVAAAATCLGLGNVKSKL